MEEEADNFAKSRSTQIPPEQIGGHTRFYEKEFPDLEECTVVKVKKIAG